MSDEIPEGVMAADGLPDVSGATTPPDIYWSDMVPELPVRLNGFTFTARCGSIERGDLPRWQVFRDNEFTPVGFIQGHRCPDFGGERRFHVYDGNNRPLFVAKEGKDDGCVPHYTTCLVAIDLYSRTTGGAQ